MLGMTAAEMLKMARRRAGVTQRELARRSGVPQPTISRIEAARMSPTFDLLARLVRSCGLMLTVQEIAGGGVDRSQIRERLRISPAMRLRAAVGSARNLQVMRERARPLPA
jgi:transcriptional regulator with XRE-family HTH domain